MGELVRLSVVFVRAIIAPYSIDWVDCCGAVVLRSVTLSSHLFPQFLLLVGPWIPFKVT